MREDAAVSPMEDLVAQMQGDRAASGDPVREGPLFLRSHRRGQTLIARSLTESHSR